MAFEPFSFHLSVTSNGHQHQIQTAKRQRLELDGNFSIDENLCPACSTRLLNVVSVLAPAIFGFFESHLVVKGRHASYSQERE